MKPHFITDLAATPLADGVNWRLDSDLGYCDRHGNLHRVPAGFVTDFASIPDLDRIGILVMVAGYGISYWSCFGLRWLDAIGVPLMLAGILVVWLAPALIRDDRLDAPATLHDNGYRRPHLGRTPWRMKFYWDALLLQAMRANGVAAWKAWLIWFNVALFGWGAWMADGKKYGRQS